MSEKTSKAIRKCLSRANPEGYSQKHEKKTKRAYRQMSKRQKTVFMSRYGA